MQIANYTDAMAFKQELDIHCRLCGNNTQSSYIVDEKGYICDSCFKLDRSAQIVADAMVKGWKQALDDDGQEDFNLPEENWPDVPDVFGLDTDEPMKGGW